MPSFSSFTVKGKSFYLVNLIIFETGNFVHEDILQTARDLIRKQRFS